MAKSEELYLKIRTCLARMYGEIKMDSASNLQNSKIFAEKILAETLNRIYGWKLEDDNPIHFNNAGFDLIDSVNMKIVQVSSTNTSKKINESLEKSDDKSFKGYEFYFMGLFVENVVTPRLKKFHKVKNINFPGQKNLLNLSSIAKECQNCQDIKKLENIAEYLQGEFGDVKISVKLNKKYSKQAHAYNVFCGLTPTPQEDKESSEFLNKILDKFDNLPTDARLLFSKALEISVVNRGKLEVNSEVLRKLLGFQFSNFKSMHKSLNDLDLCTDFNNDDDQNIYIFGFYQDDIIQTIKNFILSNQSFSFEDFFVKGDFSFFD